MQSVTTPLCCTDLVQPMRSCSVTVAKAHPLEYRTWPENVYSLSVSGPRCTPWLLDDISYLLTCRQVGVCTPSSLLGCSFTAGQIAGVIKQQQWESDLMRSDWGSVYSSSNQSNTDSAISLPLKTYCSQAPNKMCLHRSKCQRSAKLSEQFLSNCCLIVIYLSCCVSYL